MNAWMNGWVGYMNDWNDGQWESYLCIELYCFTTTATSSLRYRSSSLSYFFPEQPLKSYLGDFFFDPALSCLPAHSWSLRKPIEFFSSTAATARLTHSGPMVVFPRWVMPEARHGKSIKHKCTIMWKDAKGTHAYYRIYLNSRLQRKFRASVKFKQGWKIEVNI